MRSTGGPAAEPAEPTPALTAQQQRILGVIREWVDQHGYPPTVREIAAAAGYTSPSSVAHHLKTLERLGCLRRDPRWPRAVDVRSLPHSEGPSPARSDCDVRAAVRVPLVGTIAAGVPLLADQQVDDQLTLPTTLVGRGTLFALRVRGDSMIEAAIRDGDIVVVRQQPSADDGDIVAAMLEGAAGPEATVKVYRTRHGHVELVPRNPRYEAIPGEQAAVLGKVVAVLRRT